MASAQKTVVMIQPSKRQGQIWQAALNSQRVSVIWEASDVDLAQMLSRMDESGLPGPDLLLLDVGVLSCNPYAFCRWCREHYPAQKVVLTNVNQREISAPERQWAIYQGALDLLPGFQRETLLTGVTSAVTRLLTVMDEPSLNQEALIQVLFSITSLQHATKSRNTPPPKREDSLGTPTPARSTPTSSRKVIPNRLTEPTSELPIAKPTGTAAASQTYTWKVPMEELSQPEVEPEKVEKQPEERRRSYRGVVY